MRNHKYMQHSSKCINNNLSRARYFISFCMSYTFILCNVARLSFIKPLFSDFEDAISSFYKVVADSSSTMAENGGSINMYCLHAWNWFVIKLLSLNKVVVSPSKPGEPPG